MYMYVYMFNSHARFYVYTCDGMKAESVLSTPPPWPLVLADRLGRMAGPDIGSAFLGLNEIIIQTTNSLHRIENTFFSCDGCTFQIVSYHYFSFPMTLFSLWRYWSIWNQWTVFSHSMYRYKSPSIHKLCLSKMQCSLQDFAIVGYVLECNNYLHHNNNNYLCVLSSESAFTETLALVVHNHWKSTRKGEWVWFHPIEGHIDNVSGYSIPLKWPSYSENTGKSYQ